MVSAFDSHISSTLFADSELAAFFSDAAEIKSLIQVESELAKVQAALGVIPQEEGETISSVLGSLTIDPAAVSDGFKKDGIPIPALLKEVRKNLGDREANFLHWGATAAPHKRCTWGPQHGNIVETTWEQREHQRKTLYKQHENNMDSSREQHKTT